MNEKTKFWILLTIFIASLLLFVVLNTTLSQQLLIH